MGGEWRERGDSSPLEEEARKSEKIAGIPPMEKGSAMETFRDPPDSAPSSTSNPWAKGPRREVTDVGGRERSVPTFPQFSMKEEIEA